MGVTLRYPYEVRKEEDYFDEIENERVPKDMLDLATHIVETKKGKFQPEKFEDRYEDALKDLIKKKQKGVKIEAPEGNGTLERHQSDGCAAPEREGRPWRRPTQTGARTTPREEGPQVRGASAKPRAQGILGVFVFLQ